MIRQSSASSSSLLLSLKTTTTTTASFPVTSCHSLYVQRSGERHSSQSPGWLLSTRVLHRRLLVPPPPPPSTTSTTSLFLSSSSSSSSLWMSDLRMALNSRRRFITDTSRNTSYTTTTTSYSKEMNRLHYHDDINYNNRGGRCRSFSTTETRKTTTDLSTATTTTDTPTTDSSSTTSNSRNKAPSETFSSSSSSDGGTNSGSNDTGKKSTTTKNSYLVVNLEKKVLTDIYENIQNIEMKFKAAVERPRLAMEKQYGTTNCIDDDNQPIQIKLRHHEVLELILFSGGTALNTVPAAVLQKFYDQVVDRLDRAALTVATTKKLKEGNIAHPDDYWFRANGVKLFPPTTKHLLVVTFDTSVAWMCVYEDIQLIANKIPQLPQRPMETNQILRWLPIIVMADVSGGTGRYSKEQAILQNIVSDWPMDDCTSDRQSVCMGGTMPTQIVPPLDWNFHDALRKAPANEKEILDDLKMGDEYWKRAAPMKETSR